jgi:lysophospholipase L1-like esterase
MKRRIAVGVVSLALCLGGLVFTQAGAATKTVRASGGSVSFIATVRNSKICEWSSSPKIAGFNITVTCSSGRVSRSARFNANATTQVKRYTITLTAKGATTGVTRWTVNEAGRVPPTTTTTATTPSSGYYVSLGDSYAAGISGVSGSSSSDVGGYATQVVTDLAPNHELTLENFGCSGASTTSMMTIVGCSNYIDYPGSVTYPTMTQLAAAISFIDAHRGQIGLITITIGGNDLIQGATYASIAANIAKISKQLRAAAGESVPIIGLSYPDPDLAEWLSGPSGVAIAEASVTTFQQVLYPAWEAAYASSNATFVDIAAATGAYTPFTQLVNDPTYGEIPYAVSQLCMLTGDCANNVNVHPTPAGYTLIAQQIVLAYLKLVS